MKKPKTDFVHEVGRKGTKEKLGEGALLLDTDMATLVVLNGKLKGREYVIRNDATTIGRNGTHIDIDDESISRRHAVIYCRAGHFFVKDMGATNGTMINDKLFSGKEKVIRDGDVLQLGDVGMKLMVSESFKG